MSAETHPAAPPRVSAIVVSYNAGEDLLRCLASLERETIPLEVLVVDNASTDDSVEAVRREFPQARVFEAGSSTQSTTTRSDTLSAVRAGRALHVHRVRGSTSRPRESSNSTDLLRGATMFPTSGSSAVSGRPRQPNRM